MEAEDEADSGNKDLFDGHHHPLITTEPWGNYSPNAKRKVESAWGLFCVMRKRTRRHNYFDDISSDFDYAEKGIRNYLGPENPNDILDEGLTVDDDCWCSGSDTDLSECSEFDVISEHVGELTPSICNAPCTSEDEGTLSSDGGTSSSTQVRYGAVVNMEGSMEKTCSNDNLTLVNKHDEPIPIRSVPPDDGSSSILLETCSLHQTIRCSNEYDAHNDKHGLGISPIALTRAFEGPSRPWSICGSVAAIRNMPLVGDSSGACSSLYGNVSTSEGRTPLTLYQEEDEISFSDIDAMIRRLNLIPDDSDSCLDREEGNMSKHPTHTLLEHCTRTSVRRGIMSQGAIAVLHCRDSKHFIRKYEVW